MCQIDRQALGRMLALFRCLGLDLTLQFQRLADQGLGLVLGAFGMQAQALGDQGSQFRLLVAVPFAMGQDVADGTVVGDEGDDSPLAAAARADERKDLIGPREQRRPGVADGATQERFLFSPRASSVPMDEGLGVLISGVGLTLS